MYLNNTRKEPTNCYDIQNGCVREGNIKEPTLATVQAVVLQLSSCFLIGKRALRSLIAQILNVALIK